MLIDRLKNQRDYSWVWTVQCYGAVLRTTPTEMSSTSKGFFSGKSTKDDANSRLSYRSQAPRGISATVTVPFCASDYVFRLYRLTVNMTVFDDDADVMAADGGLF